MSEEPVMVQLEEHIESVLDASYRRMGCVAPRRNGRPVVQMVDAFEREVGSEEFQIWLEAFRGFMAVLWQEGPSPEKALKRLIALTWCVSRENLANMTQTDLALLTHETRAAWCHRVKLVYTDYLKARGFRGTRVPGQKSEGSTKIYARVATGNKSRKSGRKKGDAALPAKLTKRKHK